MSPNLNTFSRANSSGPDDHPQTHHDQHCARNLHRTHSSSLQSTQLRIMTDSCGEAAAALAFSPSNHGRLHGVVVKGTDHSARRNQRGGGGKATTATRSQRVARTVALGGGPNSPAPAGRRAAQASCRQSVSPTKSLTGSG
jgi:hypothetical protein